MASISSIRSRRGSSGSPAGAETSIACRGLPYPRSRSSRIAAIRAVSLFAFSANAGTALQEALEALEQRYDIVDTSLVDVLATVSPDAVKRLPDDLLRRVFAKLPEQMQDTLHGRLYPKPD